MNPSSGAPNRPPSPENQFARYATAEPAESFEPPLMTLVSALLFLYVGFGMGLVGISKSEIYNASVGAFVWGARGIGIGLLLVAALSFARVQAVLWLDLILGAAATTVCVLVGIIWVGHGDMQGILLFAFALLNGSSTMASLRRYRAFLARRRRSRQFDDQSTGAAS